MRTWTVDEMLDEHPCSAYTRKRLIELWACRESITWLDIEKMPIPDSDKIWGACRKGALDPDVEAAWKEVVLTRCITNYALRCGIKSIELWARRWLDGTDRSSAKAARA